MLTVIGTEIQTNWTVNKRLQGESFACIHIIPILFLSFWDEEIVTEHSETIDEYVLTRVEATQFSPKLSK